MLLLFYKCVGKSVIAVVAHRKYLRIVSVIVADDGETFRERGYFAVGGFRNLFALRLRNIQVEPGVERFVGVTFVSIEAMVHFVINSICARCNLFPVFVEGKVTALEYEFGFEAFALRSVKDARDTA